MAHQSISLNRRQVSTFRNSASSFNIKVIFFSVICNFCLLIYLSPQQKGSNLGAGSIWSCSPVCSQGHAKTQSRCLVNICWIHDAWVKEFRGCYGPVWTWGKECLWGQQKMKPWCRNPWRMSRVKTEEVQFSCQTYKEEVWFETRQAKGS